MEFRIGQGYDIHRLVEGRELWLGGIRIPSSHGLLGHSDGDALLHAVTDAILGALSLGDIGMWFSDRDPRWAGADSKDLLGRVLSDERVRRWSVVNIDCTIVTEEPKLSPHRDALVSSLAGLLGISAECVSVKSKTHEKLDSLGRGEALEAHCVVLLKESFNNSLN